MCNYKPSPNDPNCLKNQQFRCNARDMFALGLNLASIFSHRYVQRHVIM